MSEREPTRVCRITVWRQTVTGFVGGSPDYFQEIGNGTEVNGSSDGTRVSFSVKKGLGKDPNTAEVKIYNLAESSRADFARTPLRVRIEAGHGDEYRLLFVGDLRPGSGSKLERPTWETKLLLGDGSRAFANARVNKSYKKGTPFRTVLREAAGSLGLKLPKEIDASPNLQSQLATGEVLTGWASDELTRLLAPYGYGWSIQNGSLLILRDEDTRPDTARVIDVENGPMIGSPEMGTPDKSGKAPTMNVESMLYPEITPGGKIDVRSLSIRGLFKVLSVEHTGDTHGGDWKTKIEGKAL